MKRAATDVGATPRGRSPHTPQARPRAVENAPAPRLWHRVATSAGTLQAKFTVNAPGDRFEEEADRVADQVLRMPEPAAGAFSSAPPAIQRKCAACEEEETERGPLQAKESPGTIPSVPPRTESRIAAIKSTGGARLSPALRAYFEPRFGRDLSGVRLHADAHAREAARDVHARAFTVGSHIAFAAGELRPNSTEGKRLLAHELVHTVQQGGGEIRRQPAAGDQAEETDAERFARIMKALEPDPKTRRLTPAELEVVNGAERDRAAILSDAIDRLFLLVDLLRANDSRLRPMAPEIKQGVTLIRRYLRTIPSGTFGKNAENLEFDWLNVPDNKVFLDQAMRALELMIRSRGKMLPKYHFLPSECTQAGLYALTDTKVKLCPNFFGLGPDVPSVCPAWVLTHEYFHPVGLTHGEFSLGDTRMQVPGPKQAIMNANALASLAYELAGRDLATCDAPDAPTLHGWADAKYARQR